ncbi:flavin reductase family protein [Phytohabitans suffuscus]|uniref:flavin reductase family protein n=1 Tax=Phytohabitans suffuscus TaxID=624315 RepID=UPI001E352710|nr:flavin reductase [Phytohabitans suffuscus]
MSTTHIDYLEVSPKILYFGTPVALLTSVNPDGSTNAAAMSSAWALGWNLMLGVGADGATARNLAAHPEVVVNLPGPDLMRSTDELGYLTAMNPVPASKGADARHDPDKLSTVGLATLPSVSVKPPRIHGCLLQLEGVVHSMRPSVQPRTNCSLSRYGSSQCTPRPTSWCPEKTTSTPPCGNLLSTTSATTTPSAKSWATAAAQRPLLIHSIHSAKMPERTTSTT